MPRSKSTESRAARKHIRFLVSIGAITPDEAKALRKEHLSTLPQPAAKKPAAKPVKSAKPAVKSVAKAA